MFLLVDLRDFFADLGFGRRKKKTSFRAFLELVLEFF